MSFLSAFEHTVGIEGRYSNDATDRGGETMYGITVRVARANGYNDEMREMPLSVAKAIYKLQYWDLLKLDEVNEMSEAVAFELFDTAVNMGVSTSGEFLQRALNVLNLSGSIYQDMKVDGVVGPVTVAALRELLRKRGKPGAVVMCNMLNSLQGCRYISIAERDQSQEKFEFGWFANRVTID